MGGSVVVCQQHELMTEGREWSEPSWGALAVRIGGVPDVALPLDGIKVLDLSRVLAGPNCAAFLSDLGAGVTKIESTDGGDEARSWVPRKEGSRRPSWRSTATSAA